jgi:integrase
MQGHIRQRGKTSWAVVLDIGVKPNGRRNVKWHSVKGSREDAERERVRLLHELNIGAYIEPAHETVATYLRRWLDDYARMKVSAKTFERYEEIVEKQLIPALGHYKLAKLRPPHIQGYYAKACATGRRDGKGGLSAQTVLHHHRVLREALQRAVKWGLLAINPADAVEPPRPKRKETRVLDEAESAKLLAAARDGRYYVPVLLAVTTGMRRGEILGLRWSDLDLDAGTLAVRQTLEQTRAGLAFKEPKTQKSRRLVPLASIAVEALKAHRTTQVASRLALGTAYEDHGLVFPAPDGRPWNPASFSAAFVKFAAGAGLPKLRFHDLRHSHATQLLRLGIHPKIVSERLGHATTGITLDLYSHVVPGMQEDAVARVDKSLRLAIGEAGSAE